MTLPQQERSVTHSTFVIERSFPTSPERVFAALADPARKRRWMGESRAMDFEEFQMDFRAGGVEYSRYRFREGSLFPGMALVNRTTYQDIVPNRRIVFAYTMTLGEHCISASLATFELLGTAGATDLIFTDQGAFFEGADGPEMRQAGWGKLLDSLANEVVE